MNLNVEFHESILQGFFQRDGGDKRIFTPLMFTKRWEAEVELFALTMTWKMR